MQLQVIAIQLRRLTDMLEKRAMEAQMVDEYVDIGDEMPTMNYHWQ
uniref:Uncharacterized protein n=1 Tax=Setaria italica TaxID=4555 RepID=K3YD72_SETIT